MDTNSHLTSISHANYRETLSTLVFNQRPDQKCHRRCYTTTCHLISTFTSFLVKQAQLLLTEPNVTTKPAGSTIN